jgi:PTS system nitrogen regulatory IIA component
MNLRLRDVAEILNVSERTLYRWIDQEIIPCYRINEQYRFNRAELLAWATARRLNVTDQLFQEPETTGTPPPSLSETLAAGGVFYRVEGRNKSSTLRAAVELVKLPDDVDRKWVFEMLLARESLSSTGIGEAIAIPHVRYPIALHTPCPLLSLCFLENSIDFGALDGQPVRMLFVLLSPTIRGHLSLLSKLGFALRDLGFKGTVLREGSREDILREARRLETFFTKTSLSEPPAPAEAG